VPGVFTIFLTILSIYICDFVIYIVIKPFISRITEHHKMITVIIL